MKRHLATIAGAAFLAAGAFPAMAETRSAVFAGGCFWSVENNLDKVAGVLSTTSGYTGGTTDDPTYESHHSGGHREAVKVEFDTVRVSFAQLADIFFHTIDPTDPGGQFCDRGHSYTTAIYAADDAQLREGEAAKAAIAAELGRPVVTEILPAPAFWPAEDYHQDFARKNPDRYEGYRIGCGRDEQIRQVWGAAAFKGL